MAVDPKHIAAAIGAATIIAAPFIARWEGTRTVPYRDIVGVWTVCTGETRVAMRRYTKAECDTMLARTLNVDFAPAVQRAVPGIERRPQVFAAAISLSYNIGTGAFANSTVARRFRAGDWRGGCNAFLAWNQAGGREVRGLSLRRADERALCLKGVD